MSRASPAITALNAGELSPTLDGRIDLAKYAHGAKRCENFIPLVQGPVTRRGGTYYVAGIKDQTKRTWGLRFEFSATQAFVLEFGDGYVRFFTNHGQLLVSGVSAWVTSTAYSIGDLVSESGVNYYCQVAHTSGTFATDLGNGNWYPLTGDIYEIPSPYTTANLTTALGLCALDVEQSGDVLYIANKFGTVIQKKLTRLGNTNWVFSDYDPNQGPFLELNSGSTTIQASAQTGSVTLTASAALFASTDVGRLVRLESEDLDVKPWETNLAYVTNDLARFDGKTYKALNSATSGTSPPIHGQGHAFDGKTGVQWEYQDAAYGVARITGFSSSTSVTASVVQDINNGLNQLPANVVSAATPRWQLGAWSETTGYARSVAFWGPRLWWASKPDVPRLFGSVPDDPENMSPDFFGEIRADNAISRRLQSRQVNDIEWLEGGSQLLVGTSGGEFVVGPITTSEPLGPTNVQIVRQSQNRSRSVQPVGVGTSVLYAQRAGRKLLAMDFAIERDSFVSNDVAVLADRITRSGIIDMAYQSEPHSIVWVVLSSGALRGFTIDQLQDVTGWHRHPIGGVFGTGQAVVEWATTIPNPAGDGEELWLCIKRTINGATTRYVEYMKPAWVGDDDDGTTGDAEEDAFYVDSGLTYDGVEVSSISGLTHLVGQTVQILGDGAAQPDRVVDNSGAISLQTPASVVHVGLGYTSRLVPMRIETGSSEGTSQGKIKRVFGAVVRFLDTLGGKMGRYGDTLDNLSFRNPSTPMGSGATFSSGDQVVRFGGDFDRDGLIEIIQDQPLPMTVVAIFPKVKVSDKS